MGILQEGLGVNENPENIYFNLLSWGRTVCFDLISLSLGCDSQARIE